MSNERERVEHPSWCDRDACTAPEFRPTSEEYKGGAAMGSHYSSTLGTRTTNDLQIFLAQSVCPWDTEAYLTMRNGEDGIPQTVPMSAPGGGFALYALLGQEVKEAVRKWPALYAEQFPYVQRAIEDEADEATADASMPRDPVELQEQMTAEFLADEEAEERATITNPDEPRRKYAFIGCDDCGSVSTCAPAERCWRGKPEAYISKEPRVSYKLTINAKQRAEGTLQEVRAAVAELVTKRLEEAPERVALDAQTVNMAFNSGAVEESLDLRGDWYTVVDAYGQEPLRIRVTKEGA